MTREVSHLVYETFRGERPSGMHIWHRDSDLSNNALGNLCCDTPSDVATELRKMGRIPIAMKTEERFTVDEILYILTSPKCTRRLATEFRCCQRRVLEVRQSPPPKLLALQSQQESVLSLHLPCVSRANHEVILRWLVSRMLPCGFVRIDTPSRKDDVPLKESLFWSGLQSLLRVGIISPASHGAYRVVLPEAA